MSTRLVRFAVAAGAAMVMVGSALAQNYPTKAITLVVPFAPGASSDAIARAVAKDLAETLGQPVVVDNKAGAGGSTGLIAVAKSKPDGYTIGLGATGAIAVNPHLPDAPPLNPDTQLEPLAKLADIPLAFVTDAKGFPNLQAAIQKAKTTELPLGTTGTYTSQHLAAELLANMTQAKFSPVPYKGSAPAVTDLLGGQVSLVIVDLTAAHAHVKSGKLRALAVTSPKRTQIAPDVPTVAESGVPGYSATAWMGLFLPKGVPANVTDRLTTALRTILAKPEIQAQIVSYAAEPSYLDGPGFSKFIAVESKKWAEVVKKIPPPQK